MSLEASVDGDERIHERIKIVLYRLLSTHSALALAHRGNTVFLDFCYILFYLPRKTSKQIILEMNHIFEVMWLPYIRAQLKQLELLFQLTNKCQTLGCQPPGKPGKVWEFFGIGLVRELGKGPGVPVVCYRSCSSRKIQ